MPSPKFSPAMLPPGDESDDWDDSPRLPEDNVDNFTKKSLIPKKTPEKTGNESDWDSPRVPEGI